ncbi:MAG: HAMP domain-containing histidine kinase [Bacteroidaceae bacterium]|nr:HAMP domain-containing histidine kinase [Bacteroidaceae bacterium]
MSKKITILLVYVLVVCSTTFAQTTEMWQRAENDATGGRYKEAFERLRGIEQAIQANSSLSEQGKAAARYRSSLIRMNMYMKMHRSESAMEHLEKMERFANASGEEKVKNDLLYNKAIYYYTFGQTEKGNAVFKEMAAKLTASKEYDKVDKAYKMLIQGGKRSGSANMVAQAYSGYIAWKDSAAALKLADVSGALKEQIQAGEKEIAEKDSKLATRQGVIIALCVLTAVLAGALVIGALFILRLLALTRKQKKTIRQLGENIALKAKFTSNISAQMTPALRKLNVQQPEVKALLDFSDHIQTLSKLESGMGEAVETEEISLPAFCEELMSQVRGKERSGVVLNVDAPKMSASFNREYVSHILLHLLNNAVIYTPEGGHIHLDFKKRSVHKFQFLVSNTGSQIPEEKREDVFKPFLEVRDLTDGDGLGLPICQQMAIRMNGDLSIDPEFAKGTRFVLSINC